MNILVGYNGTNIGRDLLDLAIHRAKAYSGEIFVITSLMGSGKTTKKDISEAEKNLDNAKKYLDEKGVVCQTHLLVRGSTPGEDIVNFARENAIDEIAIGVKSRSKVGKLLFGSTAQYVILKAECPVTSVK